MSKFQTNVAEKAVGILKDYSNLYSHCQTFQFRLSYKVAFQSAVYSVSHLSNISTHGSLHKVKTN